MSKPIVPVDVCTDCQARTDDWRSSLDAWTFDLQGKAIAHDCDLHAKVKAEREARAADVEGDLALVLGMAATESLFKVEA